MGIAAVRCSRLGSSEISKYVTEFLSSFSVLSLPVSNWWALCFGILLCIKDVQYLKENKTSL